MAQPGVMHPADKAFYDLAIKERDRAGAENERLRERATRLEEERDDLARLFTERDLEVLRLAGIRDELEAENERLRAGWDADVDWANKLLLERDEARAENERLREALYEAIGWSYGDGPTPEDRDALEKVLEETGCKGMQNDS